VALFLFHRDSVRDIVLNHGSRTGQAYAGKVIGEEFEKSRGQVLGQVGFGLLNNLDLVPKALFQQRLGQVPDPSKRFGRIDD
jgi:hypothetical protein